MELKKGMYYRDKKGIIRKWGEYDRLVKNWDDRYNYYDEDGDLIFTFESEIAKYSNNIIDLIKVGDYVNGEYVDLFAIDFFKDHPEYIKSIVTKEQFEAMKYVVERNE